MVRLLLVMLVAFTASCSKQRLYVQPSQLAAHAEEFQSTGKARVEVNPSGTVELRSEKTLQIWIPGKRRSALWGLLRVQADDETKVVSVGQLVAQCGTDLPCLADKVRDRPVWIATRRVFNPGLLAMGTFGVVATVGSVTCLVVCEDRPNAAYVGAAIAVGALLYVLGRVE